MWMTGPVVVETLVLSAEASSAPPLMQFQFDSVDGVSVWRRGESSEPQAFVGWFCPERRLSDVALSCSLRERLQALLRVCTDDHVQLL